MPASTYGIGALLVAITGAGLVASSLWFEYWLYTAIAVGGVLLVVAFFHRPQLWIYSIVVSLYFFFNTNQDDAGASGLGGSEIAFGLYYHGTLFAWFIWQIFVRRKRLIRTQADSMFLLFTAILPLNFIIAYFNDVEPLVWLRGWQYYLLFLYYFPIREYFSSKQELRRLLIVWGMFILCASLVYVYQYKSKALDFKWANQIYYVGVRRAGYLYSVIALTCLTGLLLDIGRWRKIAWSGLFLVSFAVLIVSLARVAWLGFLVGMITLAITLPFRKRLSLIKYSLGITASIVVVAVVFFPRIAGVAATIIELRLTSSSNLSKDPSYLSRVQETEQLFAGIIEHPFGGQGLQKEHMRYDMIDLRHIVSSYGHNGYANLTYLMGIPLAALFYGIIGYYTFAGLLRSRSATDKTAQLLFTMVGCGLIDSLFVNYGASVFNQREGLFLTAFFIGFFGIAREFESRAQRKPQEITSPAEA